MYPGYKKLLEPSMIPLALFILLLIHGSLLGMSDDEAYYWVLAQRPALGYAFHPPAIAWIIALFQLFGSWFISFCHLLHLPFTLKLNSSFWVRLPAALLVAGTLALALRWLKIASNANAKEGLGRGLLVLISFAGFFALGWMMVPDLPLFFGWMLAFYGTWKLCFENDSKSQADNTMIFLGVLLTILSKYSGIFVAASCLISIFLFAPRPKKVAAFIAVLVGSSLAIAPTIMWNATHSWTSILYQLRDRHQGGELSLLRYGRFWLLEALLAGPIVILYIFNVIKQAALGFEPNKSPNKSKVKARFFLAWIIPPAAVFCVQPLWSDFKLHWAFIVWWPLALYLSLETTHRFKWPAKIQVAYGLTLGGLILLSCHLPLGNFIVSTFSHEYDPKIDATNDLYGWSEFHQFVINTNADSIAIVGSHYQTAAQAAFAMGSGAKVTMLPKDMNALRASSNNSNGEWPSLGVSENEGPEWPRLTASVLYVADNRYDAPPAFKQSECHKLGRLEKTRFSFKAKWIDLWKCGKSK